MPLLTLPRPLYRHLHSDIYQMAEDMRYRDKKTGVVYRVKQGFTWDKGTVLKIIPRIIVPHGDEMTYPSALHDMFYRYNTVTKRTADRVFRQFLIEEGLHPARAWAAWTIVRLNLPASWRWNHA